MRTSETLAPPSAGPVPTPTRGSLLAVAWVLATAGAAVDLASRRAAISVVPAVLALSLTVGAALLLAAVLVWDRVRPGAGGVGGRFGWAVPAALACLVGAVVARVVVSPTEPTVVLAAPLLAGAPALLGLVLVDRVRSTPRAAIVDRALRTATAWCAVAAVGLLVLAWGPVTWGGADPREPAVRALGASLVLVGAVAAGLAARRRRVPAAVAFAAIAVAGAMAVSAAPDDRTSASPWLMASALLVVLVLVAAAPGIGRVLPRLRPAAARARAEVSGPARRAIAAGRWALRLPLRAWRSVERAAAPPTTASRPSLDRTDRIAALTMLVGSLAYVLDGIAWARRVGWQPIAHSATIMARAHDVGTVDHPLVGISSSIGKAGGASHPGPLVPDLLAPFVRGFGMQGGALLAGAVINLVCWAVAVWAGWRAAGRVGAVVTWIAGLLVLEFAVAGAVWEANNVSVTLLAMFAAVVASWAAASGTWRAWWWAVGLGSVAAQAYLPHGLVIIGPVLFAGVAVAGAARSSTSTEEARAARHAVRVGWGIAFLAWLQPLIDVIIHDGGNVRALGEQVADPRPAVGWTGFPRGVAWIFTLPPRWHEITVSFAEYGDALDFIGGAMVPGLLVAAAVGVLWWVSRREATVAERQVRIVVLLVVVGAGINLTQLPLDELRSFELSWLVVASMCGWFALAINVTLAVRRRVPDSAQWRRAPAVRLGVVGVGIAMVAAAIAASPDRIADFKGTEFTIDRMIPSLVHQTERSLDVDGDVLVLGLDTRHTLVVADTLLSNLIVDGVEARVGPGESGEHYGPRRLVQSWSGPMIWVTSALSPVKPEGRLLAEASVPGWSRAEFDAFADDAAAQVRAAREVRLEPWVLVALPRYLAGWVEGDVCAVADEIRQGTYDVASLPSGLLAVLYADRAIASPRMSAAEIQHGADLVGQGPVEAWLVSARGGPVAKDRLLRDGSSCPPYTPPA